MGALLMKVAILQPPYPPEVSHEAARACLDWMLVALRALEKGDCDLVLLPEFANAPGLDEVELQHQFALNEGRVFLDEVGAESTRLGCLIGVGVVEMQGDRWLNGVTLFDQGRQRPFLAQKVYLTEVESTGMALAPGARVAVANHGNLRIGFALCFDLYFPSYAEAMASAGVDLILSPSYQRSETPERIRLLAQARALDAGAGLIRSSYAMEGGRTGGESLVAGPDGSLIASAGREPGVLHCEIDAFERFIKPRSHGQALVEHRALIRQHRRPGVSLPAVDRIRELQSAPGVRLCAHRGLSHACPENTLPAFSAALSLGVHEIEFDLWLSRDGVPVVCHDPQVNRTTNGQGVVTEMDWAEIRGLDAGVRTGELWRGIRMPRFEEVIELVDYRAGLNIHLKQAGDDGCLVRLVCDMIRRHGLIDQAYIAGHSEDVLAEALRYDPEVERTCLISQDHPGRQLDLALQYECSRIQFARTVRAEDCRRTHEAGLTCNLFYADEPVEAKAFIASGIDVILTNRANLLFAAEVSTPVGTMKPGEP